MGTVGDSQGHTEECMHLKMVTLQVFPDKSSKFCLEAERIMVQQRPSDWLQLIFCVSSRTIMAGFPLILSPALWTLVDSICPSFQPFRDSSSLYFPTTLWRKMTLLCVSLSYSEDTTSILFSFSHSSCQLLLVSLLSHLIENSKGGVQACSTMQLEASTSQVC